MTSLLAPIAAIVLLVAAPAASAAAPTTRTDAPRDITRSAATLVATITPGGASTTVRFDYGTSTSYGLQSAERTVSGDAPVEVAIGVTGLTAGTAYHVRATASNSAGTAIGADVSFRTAAAPRPPSSVTTAAGEVRGAAATLQGTVDPNGAATTTRFQYGLTANYGRTTPIVRLPEGDSPVPVAATIGGLTAGRIYHFRVVSTNAAGTTRGRDRVFRADRRLTGATITAAPRPAGWGQLVTFTGNLQGGAPTGVPLILERQEWPFTLGFTGVTGKQVTSGRRGAFTFSLNVFRSVRLRVSGGGVLSAPVEVLVRPKVGIRTRRTGSTLRFTGSIRPELPEGRASLQRQTPSGRFVPIQRTALQALSGGRSTYVFDVPRPRRATVWRVVVLPRPDGAYVRGVSRELFLGPAPRRSRG